MFMKSLASVMPGAINKEEGSRRLLAVPVRVEESEYSDQSMFRSAAPVLVTK
jgi:hypothetical protein